MKEEGAAIPKEKRMCVTEERILFNARIELIVVAFFDGIIASCAN